MDQFVHALDCALSQRWDEAQRALESIDEPVAGKLRMLFEALRNNDAGGAVASSGARHELGNLLTVAQANVEGMADGIVAPTPERLENVCTALAQASRVVSAGKSRSNVSALEESVVVRCPYSSARRFLESDMLPDVGAPKSRRLSLPVRGADVSKNVVVLITPAEDPMHMEQPWHVRWSPEGGGPYPDFDGELTVRADEDWESALLELRGVYSPPGGALGRLFDRAVGTRIASATARELLKGLAENLESRFREQESAKHEATEPQ